MGDLWEEIDSSPEVFRAIAESTTTAIFITAEKCIYANPAAQRMIGYSLEELKKMYFYELVHPDHREMVKQRGLSRLKGEDPPRHYQFKFIRKDGQVRWADFSGTMITIKGRPVILGTVYDITDLIEKTQELEIINEVLTHAQQSLDPDEVAELTMDTLWRSLRPKAIVFYKVKDRNPELWKTMPFEAGKYYENADVSSCICGIALRQRQLLLSEDIWTDPMCTLQECKKQGVKSFVAMPLVKDGRLLGVLGIGWDQRRALAQEKNFYEALAKGLSLVLYNATLYEELKTQKILLEVKVQQRTEELQRTVDLMVDREERMMQLKQIVRTLSEQLKKAGLEPEARDPLLQDDT